MRTLYISAPIKCASKLFVHQCTPHTYTKTLCNSVEQSNEQSNNTIVKKNYSHFLRTVRTIFDYIFRFLFSYSYVYASLCASIKREKNDMTWEKDVKKPTFPRNVTFMRQYSATFLWVLINLFFIYRMFVPLRFLALTDCEL